MAIAVCVLCFKHYKVAACLVVLATFLSVLWYNFYIFRDETPRELLSGEHKITAEVTSYSKESSSGSGTNVDVKFDFEGRTFRSRLFINSAERELSPGEVILVCAEFKDYENTEFFVGKTYYKSRYIDIFGFAEELTVISENTGFNVRYLPQYLAEKFKKMTDRLFSGETAEFLKSLILSDKSGLSDEFKEDLRATGLSHAVSVSGFHISFLVGFFLIFTKNRYLKLFAIPAVFLFALMVGAPQSALRAAIMQSLLLVSSVQKREYDSLTALSFAAFLLVFINPYCATDVGFVLSFLSTFGIIVLHKKTFAFCMTLLGDYNGRFRKVATAFLAVASVSVSATLFTIPVLSVSFNYISIIGPVSNALLNFFITSAFISGILVVLIGFVCFPVAKGVAVVLEAVVVFLMNTIKAMSKIPFSEAFVGEANVVFFACFLCFLIIFAIISGRNKIRFSVLLGVMGFSVVALMLAGTIKPIEENDGIRFDVLDVGQGQCVFVTYNDACIVVDCGGDKEADDIAISHVLHNRIKDIDAMILTHAHSDHSNGAEYLIDTIRTDKIYMPATDKYNSAFIKILNNSDENCETIFVENDMTLDVGGIAIELLTLPHGNEENENGLVVIVRDGDYELLITGDIPSDSEKLILDKLPDCESYIVGHHGSKSSSSQALLNRVLPELCVISVGAGNTYGHPSSAVLKRMENIGTNIARTDVDGTVTFYSRQVENKK